MSQDPSEYLSQLGREHRRQAALDARTQKIRAHVSVPRAGYDAGKVTRLNQYWMPPGQSADAAVAENAALLLSRARDLVRNDAAASAAVDRIVENVIGALGMDLDAEAIAGIGADGVEEFEDAYNVEADDQWKTWCAREATFEQMTFADLQEVALREVVEAGEVLLLECANQDPARTAPICWQIIEAEQLDEQRDRPRGDKQTEIRRGIELDAQRRPLHYWLYDANPFDVQTSSRNWQSKAYPASRVLHLFRRKRSGQTRAASWLAPVIRALKDMGWYIENEMQSSAIGALFAAVIKSEAGGQGGLGLASSDDEQDDDGNYFENLAPGIIARLKPNESVEQVQSVRPPSAADPWINLILQLISMGLGMSRLALTKDYRGISYSGARGNELADRRTYRRLQQWFAPYLVDMRIRWTRQAIALGRLKSVGPREYLRDPQHWLRINARNPGWDWVDPTKEVATDAAAISAGLDCHKNRMAGRGLDLFDTWRQLKRERALRARLGLQFTTDVPQPAAPLPPSPEPIPPDDDEDEV